MDLVCCEIFDIGRSGEVRRIAVRSVILLIGRPFCGFAQNDISSSSTVELTLELLGTLVTTPENPEIGFSVSRNGYPTVILPRVYGLAGRA